MGCVRGLSASSVQPPDEGPRPVWRLPASLGVAVRTFFTLGSHFLCTSSGLPHPSLAPRVCCRQASPFILSPRFHCYRPLSRALPPWPGRAGSWPVTLLSGLSFLFLLQRQKQKQPVNRSAVSLGSLTPISHSHFFFHRLHYSTSGCPQEPRSPEARRALPVTSSGPVCQEAGSAGPRLSPRQSRLLPLILSEIGGACHGRLAVCAKDGMGQCSGLPHYGVAVALIIATGGLCFWSESIMHPFIMSPFTQTLLGTSYTAAGDPEMSETRPLPSNNI